MTRAGVLQATTGPEGVYRPTRPVDQITVLDVVEVIEGTASPFLCQEIRRSGTGAGPGHRRGPSPRRPGRVNTKSVAGRAARC
ncbi:Rrf2 family transcriptional regulator [Streptomyces sp. LZ34]